MALGDEEPTKYRLVITEVAEAEIDTIYLQLLQRSPNLAERWHNGLLVEIEGLYIFPYRFPRSVSDASYENLDVRTTVYGSGHSAVRIVYGIFEELGQPEVRVLHVRHAARRVDWKDG